LLAELRRHPVPARLHVDLSEVRGFDYYTGMRVQGYVHGAAEAVLQGGRYDDLLARYGRSSPAVGFAIDVEATAGALEQQAAPAGRSNGPGGNGVRQPGAQGVGHGPDRDGGVLVSGPLDDALVAAQSLRRDGRRAAVDHAGLAGEALLAYARRWHFAEVKKLGAPRRAPGAGKLRKT
jgi:ATP phosphoribosyltransferase regulatory subunit